MNKGRTGGLASAVNSDIAVTHQEQAPWRCGDQCPEEWLWGDEVKWIQQTSTPLSRCAVQRAGKRRHQQLRTLVGSRCAVEFQRSVTQVTARKRGSSDEGKHRIFAAAKYSPKWAGLVPQGGEQPSHLHGEGTLPLSEWSIQPMDTDVWSQGTWWQENELLPIISSLHKRRGRTLSCNIEFLKSCIQVVSPPWAVNPGFWAQMCSDEVFRSCLSPSHPEGEPWEIQHGFIHTYGSQTETVEFHR